MDENEHDDGELSPDGRANIEKHYPGLLEQNEQRRLTRDLPFEPEGSAPQRHDAGDPHTERMQLQKVLADPSRTAVLDAGFKNREQALDRLDELSRATSGSAAAERQASVDDDFAPRNVNEFSGFDRPDGQAWSEDVREELQGIKAELFEAGVNPGVARAVFGQYGEFLEMDADAHVSRVETALSQFRQVHGDQACADVQRFCRSLNSDTMKIAASIAGASMLGLKEMARLGRSLGRKAAH